MSGFLIDTNVISEFVKPKPNSQVIRRLQAADSQALYAGVVTVGEPRLGIEDLPPGKRRADLERWLEKGLPEWFESNLLTVTKSIADRWGGLPLRPNEKEFHLRPPMVRSPRPLLRTA